MRILRARFQRRLADRFELADIKHVLLSIPKSPVPALSRIAMRSRVALNSIEHARTGLYTRRVLRSGKMGLARRERIWFVVRIAIAFP